jgi:ABC-2 type transport system ATP-binding protein
MQIIQTNSLTKVFGATNAVENLSLHVNQGEIYGFLGLNGAGKTTLIRMLLGMIKPNSGSIKLFDTTLTSSFKRWNDIGYLVETPFSYPNLTVKENLEVFYKLRALKDSSCIQEIIERLKLTRYQHIKAGVLSLGNQQRLGLAKALMHKPQLVILDEPINGLDPEGIVEIRDLLVEMAKNGSTVLLSSHILAEVSKIAHRIGIVHAGKLIKEITSEELNQQRQRKLIISTRNNQQALLFLRNQGYSIELNDTGELEVYDERALKTPEKLADLLVNSEMPPYTLYSYIEDLEHFFLRTIHSKTA